MLARYFAVRPEVDREPFLADYARLAALNVARILVVFARQVVRDAKPRYTAFMPRMWRYLDRYLEAPAAGRPGAWFDRNVAARGARMSGPRRPRRRWCWPRGWARACGR